MSQVASALVLATLPAVAAAGVVAGFMRRGAVPIDARGDPLEDRRTTLLRTIADLEDARASGALEEADYARLREDADARMARVLRALEQRERVVDAPSRVDVDEPDELARREPRRVPVWVVALLIVGTVSAVVLSALVRDTAPQTQASSAPPAEADDPFAFFEQRVKQHPDDLGARLDLAHRYLDAGRVEDALREYKVVLEHDPNDAEAHAHIGLVLYLAGRPEDALASVDRALETDPAYPEALFIRGVVLLRGLDRPAEAIETFERYLDAAPFGAERQAVQDLIAEARTATT